MSCYCLSMGNKIKYGQRSMDMYQLRGKKRVAKPASVADHTRLKQFQEIKTATVKLIQQTSQ